MGRLVAGAGKQDWDELTAECGALLMEGLSVMGNWSYPTTEQGQSFSVETAPLCVTGSATCHVAWLAA